MAWGDKDYQTWINHALIAAMITFVGLLFFPAPEAFRYAVWGYAFRELDQIVRSLRKGRPIDKLDAIMDVVAAVVGAGLVWTLLG